MNPIYHPEDIIYAARKIHPYLPAPLKEQVAQLLAEADTNADAFANTATRLFDLLTDNPDARTWLRGTLPRHREDITLKGGHSPIGGDVGDVPASGLLVCPTEDCSFDYLVRHAGKRVECPEHQTELVPADQKEKGG